MTQVADGLLHCPGPTRAALSYFTRDHLQLSAGDQLCVNASRPAVRAGSTDPSALLELLGQDVLVFNVPRLHAKVVQRGGWVAVGSANSSTFTLTRDEAVWLSDDPDLNAQTDAWLTELMAKASLMTRADLVALKPIWRTQEGPNPEPAGRASRPRQRAPWGSARVHLWVPMRTGSALPTTRLPKGLPTPADPTLAGYEVIEVTPGARIREGDVWVRWENGWIESPREVLRPKWQPAGKAAPAYSICAYDPSLPSIRPPEWLTAMYRTDREPGWDDRLNPKDAQRLFLLF